VAGFLVLLTLFQIAYYEFVVTSAPFKAYLGASARAAGGLLGLAGEQLVVRGDVLASSFSMSIRHGCDGLQTMAILVAAVLVFPTAGRKKLPAVAAGVGLLLALNIARIASLFWIGVHAPAYFQTTHVHVWPAVLILVAVLFWILWAIWATRPRGAA
jgi:exosortase family protein XrtM